VSELDGGEGMSAGKIVGLIVIVLVIGWFCGMWMGVFFGERKLRQAAIAVGAARWNCDPQTGERQFRFILPEVKEIDDDSE